MGEALAVSVRTKVRVLSNLCTRWVGVVVSPGKLAGQNNRGGELWFQRIESSSVYKVESD